MHHFKLQGWGVGGEKHFFQSPFKESYYPYLRVKVRTAAGQETFAHTSVRVWDTAQEQQMHTQLLVREAPGYVASFGVVSAF